MHRVNHQIRFPQVRVIGVDGEQLGIMSPDEARDIAANEGLDLVEVAPQARPPVCRIMDYGKFRYETSKRASAQKAARVEVKTITLRPKTDSHDLETKIKQARGFLAKGDRVKFVMRMRGRERAHTAMWFEKLNGILASIEDVATVSQRPAEEGRTIVAAVEPVAAAREAASRPQAPPRPAPAAAPHELHDPGPEVVHTGPAAAGRTPS